MNTPTLSPKTYCKLVEIDGTQYYIPYGLILDDQMKEALKNGKTQKQTFTTKKAIINGVEYQVPYHWDELYLKSIIK